MTARDEEILALCGRFPVTPALVAETVFHGLKSGEALARRRLRALEARGDLHRVRTEQGWVYGARPEQVGRKWRHGLQIAYLWLRLRRAGILREWAHEVTLAGGQADARTVLDVGGHTLEAWWEIEMDRPFDRWDLYGPGTGRALCIWTTGPLARRTRAPEGVRIAAGSFSESPVTIAGRLASLPAPAPVRRLADDLAAVVPEPPEPLQWRIPHPPDGLSTGSGRRFQKHPTTAVGTR